MSSSESNLPENRQELLNLVNHQATQIEQLEAKVRWFEEQFHLARHRQFGASSERSIKEQRNLFNEAEAIAEDGPVEEVLLQTITCERRKHSAVPFLEFPEQLSGGGNGHTADLTPSGNAGNASMPLRTFKSATEISRQV